MRVMCMRCRLCGSCRKRQGWESNPSRVLSRSRRDEELVDAVLERGPEALDNACLKPVHVVPEREPKSACEGVGEEEERAGSLTGARREPSQTWLERGVSGGEEMRTYVWSLREGYEACEYIASRSGCNEAQVQS